MTTYYVISCLWDIQDNKSTTIEYRMEVPRAVWRGEGMGRRNFIWKEDCSAESVPEEGLVNWEERGGCWASSVLQEGAGHKVPVVPEKMAREEKQIAHWSSRA